MNNQDFEQISTKKDLYDLEGRIIKFISETHKKFYPQKEFLNPKEFGAATGMRYSTIVYKCVNGRLKATQESPNSSWRILASEVERLKEEAEKNIK
jgi:hypothetical protein